MPSLSLNATVPGAPSTRIGTAGWSIPGDWAPAFAGDGHHLERYARVMDCAEINSTFYRSHQAATFERWAAETPPGFQFSVKVPRDITHDARLQQPRERLARFLDEVSALGHRLALILVQLPPTLVFDAALARYFFALLAKRYDGAVVCEPRHASWFTPDADRLLLDLRVARAAVDPAPHPSAARPGGWPGLTYHRWHGSPRVYWSAYGDTWLRTRASEIEAEAVRGDRWVIFDNTAAGAALGNALQFRALVAQSGAGMPAPRNRSTHPITPESPVPPGPPVA